MSYPFNDPSLPLEERISDLLSRLTLEEKIAWVPTRQAAVKRLGINEYAIGGEGAHGFVDRQGPSTTFPQTQGLASSWDRKLLKRIGEVIGKEGRSWYNRQDRKGGLSLWFPTIDMEKDPRWGRTEEAYGEDPYLAGTLAAELIKGAQGNDPHYLQISCAPKHFFANNNEKDRTRCSCSIDPRNMREYYLESFRRAFTEGKAASMMTAYNEVNGIPMMQHPTVRDIVKEEWGLKDRGHIVTDGGDFLQTVDHHRYFNQHSESIAAAFRNGVDTMTDNPEAIIEATRQALEQGLISQEDLDARLSQTLRIRFRYGQFDPPGTCPYDLLGEKDYMRPQYAELSREAVAKSAVLLKNDKDFLPLNPEKKQKILLTGPLADQNYPDWYTGVMAYHISLKQGLEQRFGKENIRYCDWRDRITLETADGRPLCLSPEDQTLITGSKGDKPAEFYLEDWGWGACLLIHCETGLLLNEELPMADHQPSDEEIAEIKRNLTFKANKPDAHNWFVTTLFSFIPQEDDRVLIRSWNGPRLIAKGENQPLKLSESPTPSPSEYFRIHWLKRGQEEVIRAAAEADICLTALGNHPLINGKEEMDRPDLQLPPPQQKLVEEIYRVQPQTAALLISSYPLACNWLNDNLPALLYASHGMQEMGHGLADVISGDRSPAGRLTMTWYKSIQDLPEMMDYDIIRSGNTYQYFQGEPLYPFGYGLSYSRFLYEDLKINKNSIKDGERLLVNFRLSNQGPNKADEIPQLYVRFGESRVKRPLKILKGYHRLTLQPGECQDVTFQLPAEELKIWDVTRERFCLEQGICEIGIGSSSEDIRLKEKIEVQGESIPPRLLNDWTWAENYDNYQNCYLHEKRGEDRAAVFSKEDYASSESAWIFFKEVDFTDGADTFEAVVSCNGAGQLLFFKENLQGEFLGSLDLPNSGEICAVPEKRMKPDWAYIKGKISALKGIQNICIQIKGQAAIHRFRIY